MFENTILREQNPKRTTARDYMEHPVTMVLCRHVEKAISCTPVKYK